MTRSLITARVWLCASALIAASSVAAAAGFDHTYFAYRGDVNDDGKLDLYVRSASTLVIPVDDIPVVIGPPVKDFVLQNRGDGSFDLITSLSASERAAVRLWAPSNVQLSIRDVDADGYADLDLLMVRIDVAGARDQILLSSRQRGLPPRKLILKTDKFMNFHHDLLAAMQNPNYFEEKAPLKVVGAEPANRLYFRSAIHAGDSQAVNFLLTTCAADHPSGACNLSTVDPYPCVRTQDLYDENGNYVGTKTRNVCNDYIHVFVYVPGSVQVAKDYSVFDEHARETKEVLDRLQNNCSLFVPSADTQRIDEIMGGIYGIPVLVGDRYFPNSTAHPPAPGDELFDQNDPTFHHYDVRTKVCDIGQPACNVTNATSYSYGGLRGFTYPSLRLQRTHTAVDGSEFWVYVPYWPEHAHDATKFTVIFGKVTQRFVQSGYWAEAVQNVTTSQHTVYPGTIARKIFQEGNSLYVRTHGMGINRLWCVTENLPSPFGQNVFGTRMAIAALNDKYGAVTFATLDREMVKFWRTQNGYTSGMSKPMFAEEGYGSGTARVGRPAQQ